MKLNKKTILIIIIIALIAGFIFYRSYFKKEEPEFELEKVIKGTVSQEVSETGTVEAGEEINLGFKSAGRIERVFIKVGDKVSIGQNLAKLDAIQLSIQLLEAQAALDAAQAKLDKLLAGSTPEEIRIAETAAVNAETDLASAKQNLIDVKASAQDDLAAAYEDALNTLDDAYLKIYNAYNTVDAVQRTYFTGSDQEGLNVKDNKSVIKSARDLAKSYLDAAKNNTTNENIDTALTKFKTALSDSYNSLVNIREICDQSIYQSNVTSADKTSLDTQKSNINTALTNITNALQTISSTKLTNEYNINTAQAEIASAEGALKKARDNLALEKAAARPEDISLSRSQVREAEAKASLLQSQIGDAYLRSPIQGQVTEINKRAGEIVQTTTNVISLIPAGDYQIKVDIYEEDVVKIKEGNMVDIELVALPNEIFKGRVASVNPSEKLIDGVVYYEATIAFDETKKDIKPGMTADIVIKTASREDVLVISKNAVLKKNGEAIVQVLKNGEVKERVVEIGLEGDEMVEILAGLEEGEEVVIE